MMSQRLLLEAQHH